MCGRVDVGVAAGDVTAAARAAPSPARTMPPRGCQTDRPEPISSGNENRSSSRAELAVVALGRLFEPLLVGAQLVLRGPRGAVDALQLRVLLAPAPVRAGDAGERPAVADHAGARHVRAAAEVLPDRLAVAVHVVVDRQLAGADLDARRRSLPPPSSPPFSPISSSLNGSSASSARASSSVTTRRTNRWPSRMMRCHLLVDGLEVLGRERLLDAEVVVEAVGDRRADAEVRLRVDALHRLREHVRRRVTQDARGRRAVDRDRLDGIRRR